MRKFIISIAICLLLATQAWAIQDFQPPWVTNPTDPQWAGGSKTSQSWEFWGNPPGTTSPSSVDNPFGHPGFTPIGAQPGFNPNGPGLTGVNTWFISPGGGFDLGIPNDPQARDTKMILLQFTTDDGNSFQPQTNPPASVVQPAGAPVGHPNGWTTYGWYITIHPNPQDETIQVRFPGPGNIGEIDVNTICVPEPATLTLLALAGLGLLVYARRQR